MILFNQNYSYRTRLLIKLLLAILTSAVFFMSYQWGNRWQQHHTANTPPPLHGVQLQPPLVLPLLSVYDATGTPFNFSDEQLGWVILILVPNTPNIVQKTIERLVEVINRLADQPTLQQKLQWLLIAPTFESQLSVKSTIFLPQLHLLTANDRQLAQLRLVLNDPTQHSTSNGTTLPSFYLINAQHQAVVLFPAAQTAATVADDLKQSLMPHFDN